MKDRASMKGTALLLLILSCLLSSCATVRYPTEEERREKEAREKMTIGEKVGEGILQALVSGLIEWGRGS